MKFDWRSFCTSNKIPFVEEGPNTKKGNINIKCPFCGNSDPSEHMGLSLNKGSPVWGCWRNSAHRGKSPVQLVARLLKCSQHRAAELVGDEVTVPDEDEFDTAISRLKDGPTKETSDRPATLRFPKEFRYLGTDDFYARKFQSYLGSRGFDYPPALCTMYDLHYALLGPQAYRIIFPVYGPDRSLLSWVGRDITSCSPLRYKALESSASVRPIDACLLDEDRLITGGRLLVVTEGPMDAAKIGYHISGYERVESTCLFGKAKESQKGLLCYYATRFNKVAVVLDQDSREEGFLLAQELNELSGSRKFFSHALSVKDPGGMREEAVKRLVSKLLRGQSK